MATWTELLLNDDVVTTEFWKLLDADVTLRGAAYLTSSGRVHKYGVPEGSGGITVPNPNLVVVVHVYPQGDGARLHEAVVTLTAYVDNVAPRSPDGKRLGLILHRAAEVVDKSRYVTGALRIHEVTKIEGNPCIFDPAAPEEHYGYSRHSAIVSTV